MDKVYLLIRSNGDQFRKVVAVFKSRDMDKINQTITDEMNEIYKKNLEDDSPYVIAESSIDKYVDRHNNIFYIEEMEVID